MSENEVARAYDGATHRLSALKFSHFSDRPLGEIKRGKFSGEWKRYDKPRGLWLSVDGEDDWEAWCIAEDFRLERLAIRHRVTLAAGANVLLIDNVDALDAFTAEYGSHLLPDYPHHKDRIDWQRVAGKHDGIIIAPYQWSRRLEGGSNWYYCWDCASGCIWQPRAIAAIEVVADLAADLDAAAPAVRSPSEG